MRIRLAIIFAVLLVVMGVPVAHAAPAPAWVLGVALAALVLAWLIVDATVLRPLSAVAQVAKAHIGRPQDETEGGSIGPEPTSASHSPPGQPTGGEPEAFHPLRAGDLETVARAIEALEELLRSRDVSLRIADEKHEQTVKDLEARYRELFDSNPHPMIVFDTEHLEILSANTLAEMRYGYTQHQFLRMTVRHLLADAVTADNNAVMERMGLFGAGPVHDYHRRRDGSIIAVEVACSRMRYGGRAAAVALFADVTERARLEAENLRRTRTLEALYASARKCAESLSVPDVALTIVGDAVHRFGAVGAWLVKVNPDGALEPVAACAAEDQTPRMLVADACSTCDDAERGAPYPSWEAIRDRSAVEYDPVADLLDCERFGLVVPASRCYGLALPLVSRDQVFGVLHALVPESNGGARCGRRPAASSGPTAAAANGGSSAASSGRTAADIAALTEASRSETRATLTSFAMVAGAALMNADLHEELRRTADRLDVRVRERTRELEAANKELEAFSYSVSHDLRAPLRAIDGFTRLAILQHGSGMNPECRTLLDSVRCGAAEMGALITSLLEFSRSARQPLNVRRVSVSDTVHSAIQGLKPDLEGRRIEWMIGDLPDCTADLVLLKQVYANLLSNAVKFSAKQAHARIEVGAMHGAETVYYVKDNGAGFDSSRANRLFGVFQRLHRSEDFPGTGVGLATVQRIVVRHGGRVWCDAAPNEGATFYFTLQEQTDA